MSQQDQKLYETLELRYGPAVAQDLVDKMIRTRHQFETLRPRSTPRAA